MSFGDVYDSIRVGEVDMFVPRGYNEWECDWIAIRVTRIRLLYEASQISESGYTIWHVIFVGLHTTRDDRMERFECSWRVPTLPRAPNQQTSDSKAHVVVGCMASVLLHERAGVFVKHQLCGLLTNSGLYIISQNVPKTIPINRRFLRRIRPLTV